MKSLILLTLPLVALLVRPAAAATNTADSVAKEVVAGYANLVEASYADSLAEAEKLKAALRKLAESPGEETLAAAKKAWVAARKPYLQTEVYRFYAGPIDDEDGPEGLINAWPMDESYVDYVEGAVETGIINNPEEYPVINKKIIEELNEKEGEENISSGFHTIEFLLWGQDLNEAGPGNRPATDYSTAGNADRRKTYLLALGDLLVDHLASLTDQWKPDADNYRAKFVAAKPMDSVRNLLTGMSMLSGFELSGERLLVALETKSQEDEHSCFSDTTHTDVILNAQGILNVWKGSYDRTDGSKISGKGVRDLAMAVDEPLAKQLDAAIKKSVKLTTQIPVPFDQAILASEGEPGPKAIMKVVTALEDQADLLVALSKKLGFEVPTTEEG